MLERSSHPVYKYRMSAEREYFYAIVFDLRIKLARVIIILH